MTNVSKEKVEVALIDGDGIGPEIAAAVTEILAVAGARIEWVPCLAGSRVFLKGDPTGLPEETIETIRRCKLALKAPLATPLGGGERSANVRLRETFDTFAAVRPAKTLRGLEASSRFPEIDLILVRENLEDLYLGVEYDLGRNVFSALKVNSEKNTRRICKATFAIARALGRKRVTGISKSNILKRTDGSFDRIFDEEAKLYPDLIADRMLVDAAACKFVTDPGRFDVVITSNLYGDILSDLTAGLAGGLGVCASVNLGCDVAIFEAVHGTAPDIAGRNVANPTALLRAAIMLLDHIGQNDVARRVEGALSLVLQERKSLTADLAAGGPSVSTTAFTQAVIDALPKVELVDGETRWHAPSLEGLSEMGWKPDDLRSFVQASLAPTAA
ncbi:NAD-dependent isocitrate dehydrogenase [Neorhizobium sp. P12A]|uniref:isocitrate/isopropylmalate family dehydrogenase n=1 Tax=Neorhizobium sp. P12A TaxID=2268027 RepID=UPI0011EE6EB3|nr:isocitrate/isopropylmalate family dehydrogenase [Neorhizobium sp. P12A]KAA0695754.1 NAD-dependent isocitrate dehydrogenase [Neorhizobium sp. P12A]